MQPPLGQMISHVMVWKQDLANPFSSSLFFLNANAFPILINFHLFLGAMPDGAMLALLLRELAPNAEDRIF